MKKTLSTTLLILLASHLFAQETTKVETVVNTLKERISLAGYAQLGYTYDDVIRQSNTFDIKRIIFMAHGKITDRWSCDFMYDFNGGGMLLELYTDYEFFPEFRARIGEFKIPYTIENELSPTTVELINCYSQSVCYLAGVNGSDVLCGATSGRDIGLMIYGIAFDNLLSYKLAVMNGQGINTKDKNNQKDIVGNLMINPLRCLSIGGSFIKGKGNALADSEITGIRVGENYTKNRWSVGGIFTTTPFSLRSEYLGGMDGNIKSEGFYATGCLHLFPRFDLIASYDYFNANKSVGHWQNNYIAGLQYWFYPKCRIQAQYTYSDKAKGEGSNLIQAQVQVRF